MKNIHILPTEKPTWLHKSLLSGILRKSSSCIDDMKQAQGMNICITSDEELILGGYHFNSKYGNEPEKTVQRDINSRESWEEEDYYISKIILTTDPDLIKQGVQAIPDKFLEWFVKNPSCEFIEWDKNYNRGNGKYYYKIIIPKEEPRQETLEEVAEKTKGKELFKKSNDRARKLLSEIKLLPIAETLEEYIERETKSIIEPSLRAAAIAFLRYGAKWQQEQDKNKFSKEDMMEAFHAESRVWSNRIKDWKEVTFSEWFEQFKKK